MIGLISIYLFNSGPKEVKEEAVELDTVSKEEEKADPETLVNQKEANKKKPTYTYEDFKGVYVPFEGEPYKSPIGSINPSIIVLEDESYRSFNRWDFDMTSTILDKTIEGNILTLDLDSDESEQWGLHSESGKEAFELRYDGNKKMLYSLTDDYAYYSMSNQDLQTHYDQLEIDYARIIMTVIGEPSLDQYAMWDEENMQMSISYNSKDDATQASDEVFYPEDVTHLSFVGIITYSTEGDGSIKRYHFPLDYLHEDQSGEGFRQADQAALDNPEKIVVEPFEPYSVADFIGRVEFVYE